jgi:hypothetical protein
LPKLVLAVRSQLTGTKNLESGFSGIGIEKADEHTISDRENESAFEIRTVSN